MSVEESIMHIRAAADGSEAAGNNFRALSQGASATMRPAGQALEALKSAAPLLQLAAERAQEAGSHNTYGYIQANVAYEAATRIGDTKNSNIQGGRMLVNELAGLAAESETQRMLAVPHRYHRIAAEILRLVATLEQETNFLPSVSVTAEGMVASAEQATELFLAGLAQQ